MSTIDFNFIPIPKYFQKNGWFKSENTLRFIIWAFSRCQSIPHREVIGTTPILLQPFEFVAGRLTSPVECFMTESAFRNQLRAMIKAGFLKKTTNSATNQFTCYIWVTESFSDLNDQRNDQRASNVTTNVTTTNQSKNSRIKRNHHHPEPSSPNEIPNTNDVSDDPGLIDDFSFHDDENHDHEKDKNLVIEVRNPTKSEKTPQNAKKSEEIIQHNNNYLPTPYTKNKKAYKETKTEQTPLVSLDLIVKCEPTNITMPEQDYKACIETMRSHDALTKHMTYILENPKRLCDITDWPKAVKNWKPVNKAIAIRQTNEDIAKQLVKDYEIDGSYGSTCQLYHCRDKDIKGIVFTTIGPAASTEEIIYYSNPEFQQKCDEQIANRRMKKRSA